VRFDDFNRVYRKLGIEFDTAIGESYFADDADAVVGDCLVKGIGRKDENSEAVIVDSLPGLPSFLIKKQDGSSLYMTRDLATLDFRIKTYSPETILYVVGNEQELNFKQMFALAAACGYLKTGVVAKHIGFGMVLVDGKKMSTREGTIIELEDLIAQSVQKSKEILLEKGSQIEAENLDQTAEIIGIGAIIYNDLKQSRIKNISFNWERMLDLEGGSAVYLQYTYARIKSVLRKAAGRDISSKGDFECTNESEFAVAKKIMLFPGVIEKSCRADLPHYICVYLEELAALFNTFYNESPILAADNEKIRSSRLALAENTALVIKKGLFLLGIQVPEKM
jgi:arginyl-tRNA synthetase